MDKLLADKKEEVLYELDSEEQEQEETKPKEELEGLDSDEENPEPARKKLKKVSELVSV